MQTLQIGLLTTFFIVPIVSCAQPYPCDTSKRQANLEDYNTIEHQALKIQLPNASQHSPTLTPAFTPISVPDTISFSIKGEARQKMEQLHFAIINSYGQSVIYRELAFNQGFTVIKTPLCKGTYKFILFDPAHKIKSAITTTRIRQLSHER